MIKSDVILEIENVTKKYAVDKHNDLIAVNDVSFSMKRGECVGLVGESGCGKSTMARLITGMQKPSEGKIIFENTDITGLKNKNIRDYLRNVQMVFQNPMSSFSPRMKIGSFLMEPWINFEKCSKKEAMEMAYYSLERVFLPKEYFDKYPHELSGGELQRVAIARAIALHPKLLVCDEATSALDVSTQELIIRLLEEHKDTDDFSIIFITHDLALAKNFCDRIGVMYLGRIVEMLNCKDLKNHVTHPYSRALMDSVFDVTDEKGKEIKTLEGEPPSPINLPKGCGFCGRCSKRMDICDKEVPHLKEIHHGHYVACHAL